MDSQRSPKEREMRKRDKTRALTTSIYSLGSRNSEVQKALDLGFKVLADLGEPFPTTSCTLTIFEFENK
jgi:hypothetical protein